MTCWVSQFLTRNPELAARPIAKRARHSLHFDMGGRERLAQFTGKPCHYQDGGLWLPIETNLKRITGNYWGAPGVPARVNVSDRTVEIIGSSYAQRTTRAGILDAANLSIKGAVNIPIGSRSDDSLIADGTIGGAGWQHVLRLTEDGVRETITLDSKPVGLPVNAGDWLVLDTILGGVTFPDGWVEEFDQAGMHFSLPSAQDANGDRPNCRRYARTIAGVQHLYTGIPVSWLATAIYPVVVDPDFAGGTADLQVFGYAAGNYATARGTYSEAADTDIIYVGQSTYISVYRGWLVFDTSSIGAGSTITQVNLTLTCTTDTSDTDFDLQIAKPGWSSAPASNDATYDAMLTATLDSSIWRNTNGMSVNTPYPSGDLATAYPSKTGSTYYVLRSAEDTNNSTPANSEYIYIASASFATAGYRPVLTVLYSSGSTLSAVQDGTHIDLSWV